MSYARVPGTSGFSLLDISLVFLQQEYLESLQFHVSGFKPHCITEPLELDFYGSKKGFLEFFSHLLLTLLLGVIARYRLLSELTSGKEAVQLRAAGLTGSRF